MTNEIRIAELSDKLRISDADYMILEDSEDTKKATVGDLKKALNGDSSNPSTSLYYSSDKVDGIVRNMISSIRSETGVDISDLRESLNNLLTTTCKTPLPKGFMVMDLEPNKETQFADWFGGEWECIGHVDLGIENDTVNAYIYQKNEGIDYPDSHLTNEVIAARGKYASLLDRFIAERQISDAKYMQYPAVKVHNNVASILNKGKNIEATITFKKLGNASFSFIKRTVNLFNAAACNVGGSGVNPLTNGFSVYVKTAGVTDFLVNINSESQPLSAGTYYMYGTVEFANGATGFTYDIVYTDGTFDSASPNINAGTMIIQARKSFRQIKIKVTGSFTGSPVGNPAQYLVKFSGFMITQFDKLNSYSPYQVQTITHSAQSGTTDAIFKYLCEYDMVFSSSHDFTLEYVDTSYNQSTVTEIVDKALESTDTKTDYCGLMEQYGTYIYLDNVHSTNETVASVVIDPAMRRNYNNSVKITIGDYNPNVVPTIVKPLDEITDLGSAKYVSLQVYIDRTTYSNFYENFGITIILCSDKPEATPVNYYSFAIGKKRFVQGWNNIKVPLEQFGKSGSPDLKSIRQIRLTIASNDMVAGHTIWINSIIIDQKMKPTILFAFDGTYETAFDYQYPLMYCNNVPATVFVNDRDTWNKTYMNKMCMLQYEHGWDIGDLGCNPDKELLIEDNNARDQYISLRSAKEYVSDNYCNPVSYSAPFGNLRPITVPILKNLGFKIAKTESESLCSFFSRHEFSMPMVLLSNSTTSDKIIQKIDEAVSTGQCIVVYTNNVTEYGDNLAASKTSFERVLNHVIELVSAGKIQCMTFRDFYEKCTTQN